MEQRISIERLEQAVNLFGSFDGNIRLLEQEFSVSVTNRDGELRVNGEVENTVLSAKAIQALLTLSSRGRASASRRCATSSASSAPGRRSRSAS